MKLSCLIATAIILTFKFSLAQNTDLDKGYIAFDRKDFKTAIEKLTPYAEKGNCLAQYAVGFSYGSDAMKKNDSLALYWLELAAEQKQAKAMGPLAVTYLSSSRPDANIKAYMWAMLAYEYDPKQLFTSARIVIKKYLSEDELARSNRLIAEYKERWKDKPNCE